MGPCHHWTPPVSSLLVASKLTKLNQKHKAAARLKIEGRSNEFIAEQVDIKPETLIRWFSDELLKNYIDDLSAQVEINFAEKMATVGATALDQLLEMVQKPAADTDISDFTRLEVIREILDRLPQTARNTERGKQPPSGETNNTLVFANMPNDQLAGFLHGGWRQQVPGAEDSGSNGDGRS